MNEILQFLQVALQWTSYANAHSTCAIVPVVHPYAVCTRYMYMPGYGSQFFICYHTEKIVNSVEVVK